MTDIGQLIGHFWYAFVLVIAVVGGVLLRYSTEIKLLFSGSSASKSAKFGCGISLVELEACIDKLYKFIEDEINDHDMNCKSNAGGVLKELKDLRQDIAIKIKDNSDNIMEFKCDFIAFVQSFDIVKTEIKEVLTLEKEGSKLDYVYKETISSIVTKLDKFNDKIVEMSAKLEYISNHDVGFH